MREETTIREKKKHVTNSRKPKSQWNGMKGKKKIPMKIRTESISNSYGNYKKSGLWIVDIQMKFMKRKKKLGKTRYGIQRRPTKERMK